MTFGNRDLDRAFDEWVTRSPPDYDEYVSDSDVASWEENERELLIFVCSECGLISSQLIDHGTCGVQDWWHLNVRCFQKKEEKKDEN